MLLADLFSAWTGQPHPGDPRGKRNDEAKRAHLAAGARRAEQRRQALGITGSVLRREARE